MNHSLTNHPEDSAHIKPVPFNILGILTFLTVLAYPLLTYFFIKHFNLGQVLMLITGLLGLRILLGWQFLKSAGIQLALTFMVILIILSWSQKNPAYIMMMPVLINMALMTTFGNGLFFPPTLIETFARRDYPQPPEAVVRYCRQITCIWCSLFSFNAFVSAWLAWHGPLALWSLYTGIIAHLLVAGLFLSEYFWRKWVMSPVFQRAATALPVST